MMERLEPWLDRQQQDTDWRERNLDFFKACTELLEVSGTLGLDVVLVDTELKRGVFRLLDVDGGARSELFSLGLSTIETVTKTLRFQRELAARKQLEAAETDRQALAERLERLEEQMEALKRAQEKAYEIAADKPETAQVADAEGETVNEEEGEKELIKAEADRERLDALRRRVDILGNVLTFFNGKNSYGGARKGREEVHYRRPSKANGPFRVHNAYCKHWNKSAFGSPRAFVFNFPEELGMLEKFIEHDEQLYEEWYNDQP